MARYLQPLAIILALSSTALPTVAEKPLHARIDEMILAGGGKLQPAARCDDATFLRRTYLDFAANIPRPEAVQRFLADKSPNKRVAQIDRLLKADTYAKRMQQLFHVLLMERRGDDEHWQKFLSASFDKNKPWDQMVREMIDPNADDEQTRGAAFFYTKRLEKYGQNPTDFPGLTRDVARLFLGQDLQCAQCHDHLFIKDYRQVDFQGLYTVYLNVSIRRDKKFPAVSEKPQPKKLDFVSVFDPTKQQTAPRLPSGKEAKLPKPVDKNDKKKDAKNKDKGKKHGKAKPGPLESAEFRALSWLASELPKADNKQFARNIVNRLWWVMMGHGLVHPLDLHHSENAASHPQLLELLSKEFVAHRYDIKWLLRELALTEVYQRSSQYEGKLPPEDRFLVARQRRLSAEQLAASLIQATGPWELAKPSKKPAKDGDKQEAAKTDELQEFRDSLAAAMTNPPREPEEEVRSSVKGALYFSNSDQFQRLLKPQKGNLVARLAEHKNEKVLVDELFLSILSRLPTDVERKEIVEYLSKSSGQRERKSAKSLGRSSARSNST